MDVDKSADTTSGAVAWLIEAPGPFYMATSNAGGWHFKWTEKHDHALRFARREDADGAMMAIRSIEKELFPSVFPRDPKPIEHAWAAEAPRSPSVVTL